MMNDEMIKIHNMDVSIIFLFTIHTRCWLYIVKYTHNILKKEIVEREDYIESLWVSKNLSF